MTTAHLSPPGWRSISKAASAPPRMRMSLKTTTQKSPLRTRTFLAHLPSMREVGNDKSEIIMRHTTLTIIMASVLVLSACAADDQLKGSKTGKTINFSIPNEGTRTEFSGNPTTNSGQRVNWSVGDQIDIFCDEAQSAKNASYNVIANVSQKNRGTLQPASSTMLQWGSDDGIHNFYGIYPAGVAAVSPTGVATFPVTHNQIGTVSQSVQDGETFIANPDMSLAYMVANPGPTVPVDNVSMTFNPIMTTLRIIVSPQEPKLLSSNEYCSIYAVSVVKENAKSAYADNFAYNINSHSMDVSGTTLAQEYKVSINNTTQENPTNYVRLRRPSLTGLLSLGQELQVTVFLPPFAINRLDPVKIRVYYTPTSYKQITLNIPWNKSINAGDIAEVELPNIKI